MLKAARRPAEIEPTGKMRRYVVHIDSLETDALAKSRWRTNMRLFERRKTIGVLAGASPPAADCVVGCLICGDDAATQGGKNGR
jgi:hypothetical protein